MIVLLSCISFGFGRFLHDLSGNNNKATVLSMIGTGDQGDQMISILGSDTGIVLCIFLIVGNGFVEVFLVPGVNEIIKFKY